MCLCHCGDHAVYTGPQTLQVVTPNVYSFMWVNHTSITWFGKEAISVVGITHALNSDRTGFESQFLPSLR